MKHFVTIRIKFQSAEPKPDDGTNIVGESEQHFLTKKRYCNYYDHIFLTIILPLTATQGFVGGMLTIFFIKLKFLLIT